MDDKNEPPTGRISGGCPDDEDLSWGQYSSALSAEDLESESVAEAGDTGDWALHSRRSSSNGSFLVAPDSPLEDEEVPSASKDTFSNTYGSVSPVRVEIKSHVSINRTLQPDEKKLVAKMLPKFLEDVSCFDEVLTSKVVWSWRFQRYWKWDLSLWCGLVQFLSLIYPASPSISSWRQHCSTLACLVGPPGAWMRWNLAKLNSQGLGKHGHLKWLPIGTLIANVFAACLMASLSTAVNSKTFETVATGIEFGFCGCLSTVSTLIAEFNAMRQSKQPWRAYVYAAFTICISFGLGILIYDLPVWLKGYNGDHI